MDNFKLVIKKLQTIEGGLIHKNKGEKDITSSCGIYRHVHNDASVFKYIDEVAHSLNITKPSMNWTKSDLGKINKEIDKEKEFELNVEFYKNYVKVLDLSKLPKDLGWAFFNLYINGNKLAGESLQYACNMMLDMYPNIFNKRGDIKPLDVDGLIGKGSRALIYHIAEIIDYLPIDNLYEEVWRQLFIHKAKSKYVSIATNDLASKGTDKDLQYLRGWINRCDNLLEERV